MPDASRFNIPSKYRDSDMKGPRGCLRMGAKSCSIIGIYGQNGTGKTALVEALACVKKLLQGRPLREDFAHLIMLGTEETEILCTFYWKNGENEALVDYGVAVHKNGDDFSIIREFLTFTPFAEKTGRKLSCREVIHFDNQSPTDVLFSPNNAYKSITSAYSRDVILKNIAIAEHEKKSYIFSKDMFKLFTACLPASSNALLTNLSMFSKQRMHVITQKHAGLIALDMIPFSGAAGIILPLPINGEGSIPVELVEHAEAIISRLNPVLEKIIPGMAMKLKKLGRKTDINSDIYETVELLSIRDKNELPMRFESEGIRKIISILGSLIHLYNKPSYLLIVDELDAGIFEYLLGKILQIFQQSGSGQLVFTSHNLRPLEILDDDALVFTTTNPSNRYVRLPKKQSFQNLRDFYIRSITTGCDGECLYENNNLNEVGIALALVNEEDGNE